MALFFMPASKPGGQGGEAPLHLSERSERILPKEVLNAILWPAIGLVGSIGMIYCIVLGIKVAKADEAGSREKAKKDLIGAIIGFVTIFVLIVALKIAMPILQDWVGTQITT